jgi:hypothetical protein
MRAVFGLALAILCGLPACAEPLITPYGVLEIVPRDDGLHDDQVFFTADGETKELLSGTSFSIIKTLDWGKKGQVVIFRLWSGGMRCCESYQIVRVTGYGAIVSDEFGRHGRDFFDVRITDDAISFLMERDYPSNIQHQRVDYDGMSATVTDVMEDDTGVVAAGAGEDVTRWLGALTKELFDEPGERVRFRQIMPDADLTRFRTVVANFGTYEIRDGILLASGCWPSQCGDRFGFVAVEVATGLPFAVEFYEGTRRDFVPDGAELPRPMAKQIDDELARREKQKGG